MKTYDLLIDGRWIAASSGERFAINNPAMNQPVAEVAKASREDVDKAVRAARRAFDESEWPNLPAKSRGQVLKRLAALIEENLEEIAQTEARNVGKPIRDARDEVGAGAYCFEYYGGAITRLCGETIPVSRGGFDFTLREPIGVCSLIVPWNFPFPMAAWKCAPALAAGNAIILKPASLTPLSALMLGELALQAGFPPGVFNVITGPGSTAGAAMVEHPGVDKISFTGETATGRGVMKAAADGIKRVSLELGGKSPNVIYADADVEKAARSSALAVFGNCGQDCCARSRAFVEQSVYEQFVEAFIDQTAKTVIGDPLDEATEIGPMVSLDQRRRVLDYVAKGREEGAQLAHGGEALDEGAFAGGCYIRPAVFTQARNDMLICQEEIFGPVLSVIPFTDRDEMLREVNATPYGLSGSIWTNDLNKAIDTAKRIRSGVLSINCNNSVFVEAPFGGYKQSGLGRDLGIYGLYNFTEVKNVFIDL